MAHPVILRVCFPASEDTPVGTVVYTLKGRDPLDRAMTYSVSGDQLSADPVTGDVTLVRPLDRERGSAVNTIITVTGELLHTRVI